MEKVRLVIWDLDETFWKGTLTEGGHTYLQETHDIVVELARRGIMSSICSKNDHAAVETILRDSGIWEYFVFPSVNWSSKGQRIATIVSDVQLRPATVLFIDDNHLNRAEAEHYCPDIQVADETVIPNLLFDPRFAGKDDRDLSRLKQYKVLEDKKGDAAAYLGDNTAFLRGSRIRVYIEHSVENYLDRAVELINRTNQLNFTKVRLPEADDDARVLFRAHLAAYDVNAGLVFASDKYGDYGCIGLYVMRHREAVGRKLDHFCFSCRTLGMDIESWIYNRLGRPRLAVDGEVLTDVLRPDPGIDWITEVASLEALQGEPSSIPCLGSLVVRGGCDVRAVEHYLEGMFDNCYEEMNDVVDGIAIRTDHSIFLEHAFNNVSAACQEAVKQLHYAPRHFETAIKRLPADKKNVVLLSFWSDGRFQLHRHRDTGIEVPFWLPNLPVAPLKVNLEDSNLSLSVTARKDLDYLQKHFELSGPISIDRYRDILTHLYKFVSTNTLVVFILCPVFWYKDGTDARYNLQREPELNKVSREFARQSGNTIVVDPHEFARGREAYGTFFHFSREVYRTIGLHIRGEVDRFVSETTSNSVAA